MWFVILLAIAVIPAAIEKSKGRSFALTVNGILAK